MVTQLTHDPSLTHAGERKSVKASHMESSTLNAGNGITVFSTSVPADKEYYWGFGGLDRQSGRTANIYADLVASGNGTGTAGDAIQGDLEAVITDSEGRDVKGRYNIMDLETLADFAGSSPTERPLLEVLGPGAREDLHIELQIVADSASDGVEVDPGASSARLYYTELSV